MRCAISMLAAVGQVVGDAGGAEGMAADRGFQPGIGSAAPHHVPDIGARHCARPRVFPSCRCAARNSGPLRSSPMPAAVDIGVQIGFQLVMAGHFIDLAVFLAQAQPPAFFLRIIILDLEADHGADTRAKVKAITAMSARSRRPTTRRRIHAVQQRAGFFGRDHRRRAFADRVPRPPHGMRRIGRDDLARSPASRTACGCRRGAA